MNTREKGVLLFVRTFRQRIPMLCIKPSIVTERHVTLNGGEQTDSAMGENRPTPPWGRTDRLRHGGEQTDSAMSSVGWMFRG